MDADLRDLPFDLGGSLLVKRAIRAAGDGQSVQVKGTSPDLPVHLRAWCRAEGHAFRTGDSGTMVITKSSAVTERWSGAERAGGVRPETGVADHPPRRWGLAARGALVEAGAPEFDFHLAEKEEVWSGDAARIYAMAAANQWDPATSIPWDAPFHLPAEIEEAVVQLMTYLVENETAALVVPSRFLAQLHPHFREVMQVLAIQAADEARHMEIFTRRALLRGSQPGLSTAGGQESLKTLVDEPDFAIASFLLSVLGEGTFLILLRFIARYAPDPVTEAVCRLAAQDEARHVAFGMSHLQEHAARDPGLLGRLENAVQKRHRELQHTAGLNAEVFDSLLLIAAGSWEHEDLRRGQRRMAKLVADMHESRQLRLVRLGFDETRARDLSALHTRNFM
ncbi:MAG TPA: ferritin-like domain-containing protein [Bryobacteraceae bacterium]|nr:ferritin-like domain-containing protein [Bryobacteraceae bacterium]